MLNSSPSPALNALLSTLAADDWRQIWPSLRAVRLGVGDVLWEQGRIQGALTFPTTAIVSLLCLTVEGDCAEIAVVGCDGVVGDTPSPATGSSNFRWVVQSAGAAYVLDDVTLVLDRLARAMRNYTHALLAQVAKTAVCNRFHSIEQQLSRRLLMGLDRSTNSSLKMTHESAAMLLGVRREGVSVAAHKLSQDGVIRYRRGHIDVLDRRRLEDRSCDCYWISRPRAITPPCPRNLVQPLERFGPVAEESKSSSNSSPGIMSVTSGALRSGVPSVAPRRTRRSVQASHAQEPLKAGSDQVR